MALVKFLDKSVGIPVCYALWPLAPLFSGNRGKNILVIKMWGMGDAVILLPVLEMLKKRFPDRKVFVLATKETSEVFRHEVIDEVIVFNDKVGPSLPLNFFKVIGELRSKDIGTVLDFEQFTRISAMFASMSGAKMRVGYKGLGKDRAYTHRVPFNADVHAAESFSDITGVLGVKEPVNGLEPLAITKNDDDAASKFIRENGLEKRKIVGIHPGSGTTAVARRWDPDRFAAVADMLARLGYKIVISGTPSETGLVDEVSNQMEEKSVPATSLTLKQFCALTTHFDLFISNDTGPMHLAAAMGTPTLGLMGMNTPVRYAPLGRRNRYVFKSFPCSPCVQVHKGVVPMVCPLYENAKCMEAITVNDVFSVAKQMLGKA